LCRNKLRHAAFRRPHKKTRPRVGGGSINTAPQLRGGGGIMRRHQLVYQHSIGLTPGVNPIQVLVDSAVSCPTLGESHLRCFRPEIRAETNGLVTWPPLRPGYRLFPALIVGQETLPPAKLRLPPG
jgi:hypothetical protein